MFVGYFGVGSAFSLQHSRDQEANFDINVKSKNLRKILTTKDQERKQERQLLNTMINTVDHGEEYCYKCSICSREFQRKSLMIRHLRTHTRPFQCDFCDKHFSRKDNLTRHQKQHTKDKSVAQCNLCSRKFQSSDRFAKHVLKHHQQLNEQIGNISAELANVNDGCVHANDLNNEEEEDGSDLVHDSNEGVEDDAKSTGTSSAAEGNTNIAEFMDDSNSGT